MSAAPSRPPALGFIFVTLVLLVLGFGLIIPVLPGLVTEFRGGDTAEASATFGWLVASFALMQFLSAPVLGALSDRFGRRRIILLALVGNGVDYILLGLAPSLAWLFAGRIIAGITAGALATANAYIADVTPPENRARGFGLAGAAFGIGFIIGPALGGILGDIHLRLPFFVAAGCVLLNWLYGLFVLPESLPLDRRRPFTWARANPAGAVLALRRFRGILGLAGMHFLFMFGTLMMHSSWVLYTGYRYGWSAGQVGWSLAFAGVASAIVQGRLVQPILGWLGERRGLIIGLLCTAATMTGYGLATEGWMIYGLIPLGAFGGIAGPAAQAIVTRRVPADEQGSVQGTLASLGSLAGIFAPPLATWSFGVFIAADARPHLPGVAFFEAAAVVLLALLLAWRGLHGVDARPTPAQPASTPSLL